MTKTEMPSGYASMPPWEKGELTDAPVWNWRNWTTMIGPGLLGAGAAIGGGEWLMGPVNTGRYGGAVLWVTTLSILAQCSAGIEPIYSLAYRRERRHLSWRVRDRRTGA